MLDIDKALQFLKSELDSVNHAMGIVEVIAAGRYQKRRKKAMQEAAKSLAGNKSRRANAFIPPSRLDPDANVWQ